jgi:thioredoxin 1
MGVFMGEDKELERIRSKKLREMFKRRLLEEKHTPSYEERNFPLTKPIDLTDSTFKQTIQNHPLVVVDCWAPWCAPCRMVAPVIEALALDYSGKILFGKLNVDENSGVATTFQIMSIPTLLVFKNGKLVDRIVGAQPREMLEPKISRHL